MPDFQSWFCECGPVIARLRARVDDLTEALNEEMKERDNAMEWADALAYAIAPQSVIGEHSSLNNPWANALARLSDEGKEVPIESD